MPFDRHDEFHMPYDSYVPYACRNNVTIGINIFIIMNTFQGILLVRRESNHE